MSARKGAALAAAALALCAPVLVGCSGGKPTPDLTPHVIAAADADPVRPIDGREGYKMSEFSSEPSDEEYRARIDELYTAVVIDGKKPIFAADDPVAAVYDAAIAMLDRYVLNEWYGTDDGAFKTVHTLHDLLAYDIAYDVELYDRYSNGEDIGDDPAFHIDGVFINRLAVCDGLSRAMSFLCAIEGIGCERVTGAYSGVAHAWNKVTIGGKRYNVDITADAANYSVNAGKLKKQLSHGFFMLSDETMRTFRPRLHDYDASENVALEDYDYYAEKTVTVGGSVFSATVRDAAALNRIFEAIDKSGRAVGKIELKLDFEEKINVNDGDMYATEIAEAYRKVKKADFSFTATSKPYFQYPNGVYLFMIYL